MDPIPAESGCGVVVDSPLPPIGLTAELAFFLRARREARGYSIKQLADRIGLEGKFILAIERNSSQISLKILQSICQVLGIRPSEILKKLESSKAAVDLSDWGSDELWERVRAFREGAELVSSQAETAGIQVVAYEDSNLPHFCRLPESLQAQALHSLRLKSEILKVRQLGGEGASPQQLLWVTLAGLDLVPPPELFQHLKPDSIVEIFNLQNFQLWRDFNTLKVNSYTLEEMYCLDAFYRFRREPGVNEICFSMIAGVVKGGEILFPELRSNRIEEAHSAGRLALNVHHELVCPLRNRDGQEVVAWLVMTNAKVIGVADEETSPLLGLS